MSETVAKKNHPDNSRLRSKRGQTIVVVTESIENIPEGWRGRETYTVTQDKLTENFELAEPDKDFAPYTTASFSKSN